MLLFVWRDFVSVYKQTVLGPAWHIVRPLLTTAIFTVVFSRVARLSTDGVPPFAFYMAGQVVWTYFATSIENIARTFIVNAHLLGKVYFHRLVIPLSLVMSNLIAFGIQLGLLLLILTPYLVSGDVRPTVWLAAAPLLVLILAGYALAFGLIVCALTTRYRDLTYLITFGLQLLMYVSPVIYPLSAVPAQYRLFVQLNPVTPLLEGFRRGLIGVGSVSAADIAVSAAMMLAALTCGLMVFTRAERTFVDTV